MKRILPVCFALALAGCTVGPNYKRPQLTLPGEFRGAPAPGALPDASFGDTKWQNLFADDTLNRMVNAALANNFDLRVAAERAEQARAQLGIARANQFPQLDLQAGFTAERGSGIAATTVPPGSKLSGSYSTLGAALSWEVDVFGRLRRLTEAARAQYLSSREGRNAVTVSLVASVMDGYFQLLEQDLELEISRKTKATAEDSLRLVELRHKEGAAAGLDVSQARQLIYTAAARTAATQRASVQAENLLSLLQGAAPGVQAHTRKLEEIVVPAQMPPGLPATLLAHRPDIRGAEQDLIAANAQIGVARALYYPQISLTAFAGGESRSLLQLASAPARVYSVAPTALLAVFHAGQIRNQVRYSEARQRELLIAYQKAIYSALREVSDALVGFDRLREERHQQELLQDTLEDTVRFSVLRYRGGMDSYLQVLDAQRNLFTVQLSLAQLRLQERVAVVDLYRALGGGWS